MPDQTQILKGWVSMQEPGEPIPGGRAALPASFSETGRRSALKLLLELGVLRQGRWKQLRKVRDFPDLGDWRHAPTHVYRIKYVREGKTRIRYTKCRAGRLAAKLERFKNIEGMRVLGISEAWQTPWSDCPLVLREHGVPRYSQVP